MVWHEIPAAERRQTVEDGIELDAWGHPVAPTLIVTVRSGDVTGREMSPHGPIAIAVAEHADDVDEPVLAWADLVLVADGARAGAVTLADPLLAARELAARIDDNPVAAVTLAWLLRTEAYSDVGRGLIMESASYSMLLAGAEFRRWRQERPARPIVETSGPRVRMSRDADVLRVTLANPDRRNAMDARMRDELVEALELARLDGAVRVRIDAEGPSFGSGGDLDEFGTAPDLARAHLTRTVASVGRRIADLAERVEVHVHGRCFGAGIEVPAFADRIFAHPDTTFTLPEISMGLIPGAGGTTSVPRRIGRHRTAWWALSGRPIDAETALAWGLIDGIE